MGKVILHYFGTDLDSAGHFFWELENEGIYKSRMSFGELPFNPEGLPYKNKRNGIAKYYQFAGFSIFAIAGSCADNRPGSKSIFFVEADISSDELMNKILSTKMAKKIIDKMPFKVEW